MRTYTSTVMFSIALLLIPLAVWVEHSNAKLWNQRLFMPELEEEPNRHTPIYAEGTFLPPVILKDLVLDPEDNPVILPWTTRVPKNVMLTINPGVLLYAHEYASLNVEGTLHVNGTQQQPIILTTNEEHVENRVWGGIQFQPGSTGTIIYANIRHASPAISCLDGSNVNISNSTLELGNLGIFTKSNSCAITNSAIHSVRDGVVAIGANPRITDTVISAKQNDVITYEIASPNSKELGSPMTKQ